MAAPKGHAKYGGRKKGTPNKVTEDLRQKINEIVGKEIPYVLEAFKEVREEDKAKYLQLLQKYIEMVLPKQQEIKADLSNNADKLRDLLAECE